MRIDLVIADEDNNYRGRIAGYLSSENEYRVSQFSKANELIAYLEKYRCDILLVTPEIYTEKLATYDVRTIILLLEDEQERLVYGTSSIYKYQSITNIEKYILEEDTKNSTTARPKSHYAGTKIISVYSPIGGVGKTTVAVSLAMQYARLGRRVFYLNLEEIASTESYFRVSENNSLTKVLESLAMEQTVDLNEIKQMDDEYNIGYFSPLKQLADNSLITVEKLIMLLHRLKEFDMYDILIIDTNSRMSDITKCLLGECSEIVFVGASTENASLKMAKWLAEAQEVVKKAFIIYNNVDSNISMIDNIMAIGRIPKLGDNSEREKCKQIVNQEYIRI